MRLWVLWFALVATSATAQEYDEAAARDTLAACLDEANDLHDCIGAVTAACRQRSPDEREFLELPCGEAEFGAWAEVLLTEKETAFRHVEAFENTLLDGGANPEYLVLYRYLSESQQGWEAYVRSQCAIAPQAAALQGEDSPEDGNCEVGKYADRIAELRQMVEGLN